MNDALITIKRLCLLLPCVVFFAAGLQAEPIFGREGIRSPLLAGKFSKWDEMLMHWELRNGFKKNSCETGWFSVCLFNDLQDLMRQLQGLEKWAQMKKINAFVNQVPYFEDMQIYGVEDYWAIPQEMFDNDAGDCEDYSIAKYLALKKLGFAVKDLRIAIVEDVNLSVNTAIHSVLIVRYQDKDYVLDNRDYYIVEADRIEHYRPIYAINEESWWLF
ncbi:MAG: transglutaminase-like cysteine peptidase [Gammaproteobacteria bacterium]